MLEINNTVSQFLIFICKQQTSEFAIHRIDDVQSQAVVKQRGSEFRLKYINFERTYWLWTLHLLSSKCKVQNHFKRTLFFFFFIN